MRAYAAAIAATLAWLLLSYACSAHLSFNGFKQYSLLALSDEAASKVHWLHDEFPPEPNPNTGLTFLTLPSGRSENVHLLVPPAMETTFLDAVRATPALRVHLEHSNYGRLIAQFDRQNEMSRAAKRVRRQASSAQSEFTMRHDFYRSYRQIIQALEQLRNKCNKISPGTCKLVQIGTTYEKRQLTVLRIEKDSPPVNKTKIWLDGGIHAREWISPATVLYIADRLINSLSSADGIVDKHDFMILPLMNPDGYQFSRLRNRLWRKNREPTGNRDCPGVDLNRNYGHRWGGPGSSGVACSITYRGSSAFSAAETAAVKTFIESEAPGFLVFLSFHSYGQYILMPYGYKSATYSATHDEKMRCAAYKAVYSMYAVDNRFYTYGTGPDLMYAAPGGSDDWAHGDAKVPYSFTFELPDTGEFGFLLPPAFVPGVGSETMAGLRALLDSVRQLESGNETLSNFCRSVQV